MSKKKQEKTFRRAIETSDYTCLCCDEEKKNKEFLINRSYIYRARERMAVCNQCVGELYKKFLDETDEADDVDVRNKTALYSLCRQFDYMYSESQYKGSVAQASKMGSDFLIMYLQKIGSLAQYRLKRFEHSDTPPSKDFLSVGGEYEVTKEMIRRWGKGYDSEEYIQLEDFFQQMVESSGCEDPIQENTLKNISKTQLKADKSLSEGIVKEYTDLTKAISVMMKDGGITPSSQNNDNDERAIIGMWTKMVEEDEPIPEPLEMFQDVDRLGHYIKKWFVQHFARVFGIVNDNDVDYESEYKEPTDKTNEDVIEVEVDNNEDRK